MIQDDDDSPFRKRSSCISSSSVFLSPNVITEIRKIYYVYCIFSFISMINIVISNADICTDFLEVSWYSLEQYIWLYSRQAFNYCCSLLQV